MSYRTCKMAATVFIFVVSCISTAGAQTVDIPYQGWLTQGELPCSGPHNMVFTLYDELDAPVQSFVFDPTDLGSVDVENGAFSVVLPVPEAAVIGNAALYLGITVEGVELANRQRIYPSMYAVRNAPGSNFHVDANLGVGIDSPETRLQLRNCPDVSVSGGGCLLVGGVGGENLAMDNNEIMARNNGQFSTLYLNNNGGDTHAGGGMSVAEDVTVGGTLFIGGRGTRRIIECSYAGTNFGSAGGFRYHHWVGGECRRDLSVTELPSGNCIAFITKAHSTYDDSDWRVVKPGETLADVNSLQWPNGGMIFWNQDGNADRIHIQAVYMCD